MCVPPSVYGCVCVNVLDFIFRVFLPIFRCNSFPSLWVWFGYDLQFVIALLECFALFLFCLFGWLGGWIAENAELSLAAPTLLHLFVLFECMFDE